MGKSSESCEHVEEYHGTGGGDFDDSIEETKPSWAVWLITFTVAMGGFLFGERYSPPCLNMANDMQ